MALEQFFVNHGALNRIREGPLAPELNGFCEWLYKGGFARFTICRHISNVSHFSRYLEKRKLPNLAALNSHHIGEFITEHLPHCRHRRRGAKHYYGVAFSLHRFMGYLQEYGLVDATDHCAAPCQNILDEYIQWMKDYHNSSSGTLRLRKQYLSKFLNGLSSGSIFQQLSTLSHDSIEKFFLTYCQSYGPAARRSMQATLRTFFRFCYFQGYTLRDFSDTVPTLRTYKLNEVPRSISEKDAQLLLSSIDRSSNTGKRDYAIIQMLYTYGIRGGQIRALRLKDIDWRQNRIYFSALKQGKDIIQPLTDDVGESLLDYLHYARPDSCCPEVFLTSCAPYRPLRYSTTLSEIIARNIRAAGIQAQTYGAHTLRHRFASRMIEQGHSLKSIADMIGHRCIQTTFIYTKVDFQSLHQVALEWPEEGL